MIDEVLLTQDKHVHPSFFNLMCIIYIRTSLCRLWKKLTIMISHVLKISTKILAAEICLFNKQKNSEWGFYNEKQAHSIRWTEVNLGLLECSISSQVIEKVANNVHRPRRYFYKCKLSKTWPVARQVSISKSLLLLLEAAITNYIHM